MASPFLLLVVVFNIFAPLASCFSFRPTTHDREHEFPVLRLDRRDMRVNQTTSNTTLSDLYAESYACRFTQEYVFQAAEANCSTYIQPLELVASLPLWERYETASSFANCTYHQIATRFPDIPNGVLPTLVFRDGTLVFTPRPDMSDARNFSPPPPIKPLVPLDQAKAAPFLPILKDATAPFFQRFADATPSACTNSGDSRVNSTYANTTTAIPIGSSTSLPNPGSLLESIDIAAHQYTRCAIQQPSSIHECTVSTVSKLGFLPPSLYIYFGAQQCDSQLWSFVSVGLSILLDVAHMVAMWFLRGPPGPHVSFSWLQFLIRLASGVGEPAIQAVLLQKANSHGPDTSTGFVLAAMEFLQPTAAPLLAAAAGWLFSKGHGFQVLATDAITTLLGCAMVLGFTSMRIITVGMAIVQGEGGQGALGGSFLVPIGMLCAVGPWVLTYLLFGMVSLPMQLGLFLGMFELLAGGKTAYGFGIFFFCLWVLVVVLGFVAATPLFAIWEAVWIAVQKKREWRAARENKEYERAEDEEKAMFPLARWFRRKFQNTSRFKRGLVKFVFWLFILMSLASFVGKWMFMVNVLAFAGDAYCPNGYKEATFGGLGFKAAVLSISVVLQFFGLTA